MDQRWLSPFIRRLALREWVALFLVLFSLALVLGWQNGLGRLDQSLYDLFLSSHAKPVREDVVIVAIDDYSIAELGHWPWPRRHHANIINTIGKAQPRAIGLDVLLSEQDTRDARLIAALQRYPLVVLPVAMTSAGMGTTAGLPLKALAHSAAALGHINLAHDNDGVVRSIFLCGGQRTPL